MSGEDMAAMFHKMDPGNFIQLCGFSKKQLMTKALDYGLQVYEIFHIHFKLKNGFPHEIQAIIFDVSASWLDNNWKRNLQTICENLE